MGRAWFGGRHSRRQQPHRTTPTAGRANLFQHRLRIEPLEDRRMLSIYAVNSLADLMAADGFITLREALQAANTNAIVFDAPAGSATESDVITFAPELFTDGVNPLPGKITLGGTSLSLTDAAGVDIQGPGAELLTIDAANRSSVFQVELVGAKAALSRMTITGGSGGDVRNDGGIISVIDSIITGNSSGPSGGGIYSSGGTLSVINSTISGNSTGSDGGGIFSYGGTLSVINSTISGNSASSRGGGICSLGGTLSVINSTISGNSAGRNGGGINSTSGTLFIANSTISGNLGAVAGGGICGISTTVSIANSTISGNSAVQNGGGVSISDTNASLSVTNSTISGNSAGTDGGGIYIYRCTPSIITNSTIWGNSAANCGGGLYVSYGEPFLHNSVVAGNLVGDSSQVSGTLAPGSSYNLIGLSVGLSGIANGGNGNQIGDTTPLDPMLGPLQDNGGPTWTYAPLPGSPLVDAGGDANAIDSKGLSLVLDQRGLARRFAGVDIGAVETQPLGVPVACSDGCDVAQGGSVTVDVLANDFCNDGSPMDVEIVAMPLHGTLVDNLDGTFTYTPEGTFWGTDTFSYRAINGSLASTAANVVLSVLSPTSVVVTTVDDETDGDVAPGDISLREALGLASPGSTIQFSAALLDRVITLTHASKTLPVSNVQIIGLGASHLVIDGNRQGAVFQAASGNSLISRLLVTGGSTGGIVVSSGAELSLDHVAVFRNTCSKSGGGGVDNAGTLIVTNSTISYNSAVSLSGRGGGIRNTGYCSITDSTLSNNIAKSASIGSSRGGAIDSSGTCVITNSTISDNTAENAGGAIYCSGTCNITNSTFSRNTLNGSPFGDGGAIYISPSGTCTITDSTMRGNSAAGKVESSGGAITSTGTCSITNSTLSGNSASDGGAICQFAGSLTLANSTIAGNSADRGGGVCGLPDGTSIIVTLANSIIAANDGSDGADVFGTLTSTGRNLIGSDPSFVRDPSPGGDGTWGTADDDYGDLHLTAASLAIDMGNDDDVPGGLTTDLDGNPRIVGDHVDLGAYEFQEAVPPGRETPSLVVSTLDDVVDPYDGTISLREALFYAGDDAIGDTITFAAALAGGTIVLDGQALTVDHPVSIDASSVGDMTISAAGRSGVFFVLSSEKVKLIHLVITGGSCAMGGGVFNAGTLDIVNSVIVGNSASRYGGGVGNYGTLSVANSTISGNTAGGTGGGIDNSGTLTLANAIVALNGPNGDVNLSGTVTFVGRNPIGSYPSFVRNPSPGDDGTWGTADDDLGDLHLTSSSSAIDTGMDEAVPEGLTTDLDGNARIVGEHVDLGAYEFQATVPPGRETPSLVVSTLDDAYDLYDGVVSLREALFYAGDDALGGTITFAAALGGGTIVLNGQALCIDRAVSIDAASVGGITIDAAGKSRAFSVLSSQEVQLIGLVITGGGVYNSGALSIINSTISENSTSNSGGGVFNSGSLSIINSTVSRNSAGNNGGGVYSSSSGSLSIVNSTISDNSTSNSGGGVYNSGTLSITNTTVLRNSAGSDGGGVNNSSGALSIANSTFSHNSASGDGGGVYTYGTLSIVNSTFSHNSASGDGGGARNIADGTMTIVNSTFSHNSASSIGGGICISSRVTLNNTIVAENVAARGPDVFSYSGSMSGSRNLIGDGSGQSSLVNGSNGNLVGTSAAPIDPKLSALTQFDNGLWGYYLLPGSPAINAGSNALAVDASGNPLTTDLDGNARILYGTVDIGACEFGVLGDANYDRIVNDLDMAILASHWRQAGGWADGDFNADGVVNDRDASILAAHWHAAAPGTILGDANVDGAVNELDSAILANHWRQTGGWIDGDFNGDEFVDDLDAAILTAHWGETIEAQTPVVEVETPDVAPAVVLEATFIGPRQASALASTRRRIEPCRSAVVVTETLAPALTREAQALAEPVTRAEPAAHVESDAQPTAAAAYDAALAEGLSDAEWLEYRLAWSAEQAQPRGRRLLQPVAGCLVLE